MRLWVSLLAAALLVVGCGDGDDDASGSAVGAEVSPEADAPRFPDVVDVAIEPLGGEEYRVAVTLSSPYDSPERYADAWRVLDPQGVELGVRVLAHDHANEQPFTRDTTVAIPARVEEVTVEGRDLVNGYGGTTRTVSVPVSTDG